MLTVKEADANWRELADRAAAGETVTIERADRRRLSLKVVPELRDDMTEDEWLDYWEARAVRPAPHAEDTVTLFRRLRGHSD